ncbi:hypothetical protein TorRG33x02_042670 [Trema orientale]|uniref:Uncharacterized protein n=1 Tax=Trema orientale TaxID=63057 RepID=A0A2P5FPX1_TREOI|nr:hypothetical protein TorRG33x02_042670 [Trema orientale]
MVFNMSRDNLVFNRSGDHLMFNSNGDHLVVNRSGDHLGFNMSGDQLCFNMSGDHLGFNSTGDNLVFNRCSHLSLKVYILFANVNNIQHKVRSSNLFQTDSSNEDQMLTYRINTHCSSSK